MHNSIAPDHFLGGISERLKQICFLFVGRHQRTTYLDLMLRVHMKGIGIGSQKILITQKKEALNSIKISLVASMPVVLNDYHVEIGSELFFAKKIY